MSIISRIYEAMSTLHTFDRNLAQHGFTIHVRDNGKKVYVRNAETGHVQFQFFKNYNPKQKGPIAMTHDNLLSQTGRIDFKFMGETSTVVPLTTRHYAFVNSPNTGKECEVQNLDFSTEEKRFQMSLTEKISIDNSWKLIQMLNDSVPAVPVSKDMEIVVDVDFDTDWLSIVLSELNRLKREKA